MENILTKEGYLISKITNSEQVINKIKENLTVVPFLSFSIGNVKPESFTVFQENDEYLCIPKYYGLLKYGKPTIDKQINGEIVNLNFKGSMKLPQINIINEILPKIHDGDGGLLVLPCGFGKTVIALNIATILKVKTLIIVHKSFLLNQWKQRALEFTDADIGIIQRDKIDIDGKQIVIGMLQSIAKDKYNSEIFQDFGLVIFDEAHHAPSKYFSKALPIIACKKTLALSATPKRSDKLEKILHWYFGPLLYKAPTEILNNVLVKIFKYNSSHKHFKEYKLYTGDINRPKTINKLVELESRNDFIINTILEIIEEEDRKLLVLSDRIEHLNKLKELVDNKNLDIKTSFYIGGMKQKKLDEAEKAQIIFASYSMASEGLDIPELNTLLMVSPRKEVEQSIGRITRKKDHIVQPLVIDIVDQLPSFARQGLVRRKFYSKKDFQIKLFDVEENKVVSESYYKSDSAEVCNSEDLDFID